MQSWHLKVCGFVEEQPNDQQKNDKNKKHTETQTQVMKQSPGNPRVLEARRSTSVATGTNMASLWGKGYHYNHTGEAEP